jgi:hypothetical protein
MRTTESMSQKIDWDSFWIGAYFGVCIAIIVGSLAVVAYRNQF